MLALPLVGGCLLALGIIADGFGWWTTRPFLTNLVSGMTSACFGIPFALLILASFTEHQAKQVQRANAENLFDGALRTLTTWVHRITATESHDRLDIAVESLTRPVLELISRVIDRYEEEPPEIAELLDAMSALQELLTRDFSFLVDMEEHWASTRAHWRFMNDYVKPRMYEQGLDWIRADAAARFDTVLSAANPYLPVIRLRERLSVRTDEVAGLDTDDLRPAISHDLRQLRGAIVELRRQLPRAMRLREALAIARGEPFEIGLEPGWGLQL